MPSNALPTTMVAVTLLVLPSSTDTGASPAVGHVHAYRLRVGDYAKRALPTFTVATVACDVAVQNGHRTRDCVGHLDTVADGIDGHAGWDRAQRARRADDNWSRR
jgi:hypothetical protein